MNARESFSQLPGSNENSREIYRHWGEYLGSEGSQGSLVWGGCCHRVSKGLQARVGRGLGGRRASWRREAGPPMCPREKPFGPAAMNHGRLGKAGTRSGLGHRLLRLLRAMSRKPGDQQDGPAISGAGSGQHFGWKERSVFQWGWEAAR